MISIKVKMQSNSFRLENMTSKSLISLRITGICGILAPIIGLTCIGLAVLLSPLVQLD